jgi:hypothetical protein
MTTRSRTASWQRSLLDPLPGSDAGGSNAKGGTAGGDFAAEEREDWEQLRQEFLAAAPEKDIEKVLAVLEDPEARAAMELRSPVLVRERSASILAAAECDRLSHFSLRRERLAKAADYVIATTRARFPDLRVPMHSRWRHLLIDGRDLWADLASTLDVDDRERARIRIDLAFVSVLLDAGAGSLWRYREPTSGRSFARSEGLALASFEAFRSGLFSSEPRTPLRVDARALRKISGRVLAGAFQAGPENPLVGIEERARLLRQLGTAISRFAPFHGLPAVRPGHLVDHFHALAGAGIDELQLFMTVQELIGEIWPGRLRLAGLNLGDTWPHPAAGGRGRGRGLVPFHKLVQWLVYSLVEPLQEAGFAVETGEVLTPLAEYRNGGLLIDTGVITPKHSGITEDSLPPGDEAVIEWRALTVALIDQLAALIRDKLGLDAERLPLSAILEGGTWAAGRRIAAEKRPDGSPPIRIASDGTLF